MHTYNICVGNCEELPYIRQFIGQYSQLTAIDIQKPNVEMEFSAHFQQALLSFKVMPQTQMIILIRLLN